MDQNTPLRQKQPMMNSESGCSGQTAIREDTENDNASSDNPDHGRQEEFKEVVIQDEEEPYVEPKNELEAFDNNNFEHLQQ